MVCQLDGLDRRSALQRKGTQRYAMQPDVLTRLPPSMAARTGQFAGEYLSHPGGPEAGLLGGLTRGRSTRPAAAC